jgi:hypothetical protein
MRVPVPSLHPYRRHAAAHREAERPSDSVWSVLPSASGRRPRPPPRDAGHEPHYRDDRDHWHHRNHRNHRTASTAGPGLVSSPGPITIFSMNPRSLRRLAPKAGRLKSRRRRHQVRLRGLDRRGPRVPASLLPKARPHRIRVGAGRLFVFVAVTLVARQLGSSVSYSQTSARATSGLNTSLTILAAGCVAGRLGSKRSGARTKNHSPREEFSANTANRKSIVADRGDG